MKRASDDPASDAHKKPKTADSEDEDEQLQALAADLRRRMPDLEAAVRASARMRDAFKIACKEMVKWKLVAENAELRAKVADLEGKVKLPHGKGTFLLKPNDKYVGEWRGLRFDDARIKRESCAVRYYRTPHGEGKRTYCGAFRNCHEGTFDHGVLVRGKQTFHDPRKPIVRRVVEGTFVDHQVSVGKRTHCDMDGRRLRVEEGRFTKGRLVQGREVAYNVDDTERMSKEGTFDRGLLVQGTEICYSDGAVCERSEGTFDQGELDGEGRFVSYHDGTKWLTKRGTFDGGQLVRGEVVRFRPNGERTVEVVGVE